MKGWTLLEVNKFDDLHELPLQSGVYIVVNKDDEIIYVGKAANLRSRWWAAKVAKTDHRSYNDSTYRGWYSQNSIYWKPHKMLDHLLDQECSLKYKLVDKLAATYLELDLINELSPSHNVRTC